MSSFRVQQLLPALQGIHEKISGIAGRFVHLVATDTPLIEATSAKLAALLTYGDPYQGPSEGPAIVVSPRFGTVSPWASKATDIARNCGIAIRRVERITEYRIVLKAGLLGTGAEAARHQRLRAISSRA